MRRNEALEILNKGFDHTIKDPLWGNIPITKEIKNILMVKDVQKLARIKQNGPAYHIYPGAVHTRLNHSLGVYYLGRKILISISSRSDQLPFSKNGIISFLVACLLHDIGHFPYAHSLKELAIREHEEIAATMILENEELYAAVENAGADPEMVAAIICKDEETEDQETLLYRGILSGTLDPDKLDYLSRDGFFAGVPYGKQDTDYIISSLSLHDGEICLDSEALSSVEQILFSKYMMYKTIYWHKGVRSATAMIKKALIIAIEDGTIDYDDLYFLDDNQFNTLCKSREDKTEALKMVDRVEHNNLLEKAAEMDYQEDGRIEMEGKHPISRRNIERKIFSSLNSRYPELKEYEVIIDIPEPISFETRIKILNQYNVKTELKDEDLIFSSAVSKTFQKRLRKVSLYLPDYVDKPIALGALKGIEDGR